MYIAFVFLTLLNIPWNVDKHAPAEMLSEILPLETLKKSLIKSKVCKNPRKLTGRDLCLILRETTKLLSNVGVVEGPVEDKVSVNFRRGAGRCIIARDGPKSHALLAKPRLDGARAMLHNKLYEWHQVRPSNSHDN